MTLINAHVYLTKKWREKMSYSRNNILEWYESKGGKIIIDNYINNQAKFIEKHYLADNDDILENMGIYRIDFNDIPIYVGQSGVLAYRILTHVYNIINGETEWGISPSEVLNRNVQINIFIIENEFDQNVREEKETDFIHQFKPLLQSKNEKYYPFDKSKMMDKRWVKRDDIPIDWCIRSNIRKEVVREKLGL
jgi:hypothetical protein